VTEIEIEIGDVFSVGAGPINKNTCTSVIFAMNGFRNEKAKKNIPY
jgi:hypothetical protein